MGGPGSVGVGVASGGPLGEGEGGGGGGGESGRLGANDRDGPGLEDAGTELPQPATTSMSARPTVADRARVGTTSPLRRVASSRRGGSSAPAPKRGSHRTEGQKPDEQPAAGRRTR
jgi:hypothetical protein